MLQGERNPWWQERSGRPTLAPNVERALRIDERSFLLGRPSHSARGTFAAALGTIAVLSILLALYSVILAAVSFVALGLSAWTLLVAPHRFLVSDSRIARIRRGGRITLMRWEDVWRVDSFEFITGDGVRSGRWAFHVRGLAGGQWTDFVLSEALRGVIDFAGLALERLPRSAIEPGARIALEEVAAFAGQARSGSRA